MYQGQAGPGIYLDGQGPMRSCELAPFRPGPCAPECSSLPRESTFHMLHSISTKLANILGSALH